MKLRTLITLSIPFLLVLTPALAPGGAILILLLIWNQLADHLHHTVWHLYIGILCAALLSAAAFHAHAGETLLLALVAAAALPLDLAFSHRVAARTRRYNHRRSPSYSQAPLTKSHLRQAAMWEGALLAPVLIVPASVALFLARASWYDHCSEALASVGYFVAKGRSIGGSLYVNGLAHGAEGFTRSFARAFPSLGLRDETEATKAKTSGSKHLTEAQQALGMEKCRFCETTVMRKKDNSCPACGARL